MDRKHQCSDPVREARPVLECVVNVSEGRDKTVLRRLDAAAGTDLLDRHSDPHHHRSVLTLVGVEAPRAVAEEAVRSIDIRAHRGVHPRLGVVDVVPFVPLDGSTMADAERARDEFATWFADFVGVPCFLYGQERPLPDVRRQAFADLVPDIGPLHPHPTAGATAVGARSVLIAFNVWVEGLSLDGAKAVAQTVRGPSIRALALEVGESLQISMNLTAPATLGPDIAFTQVEKEVRSAGGEVAGAELVGLLPRAVLHRIETSRWTQLDLAEERTIEARLRRRGLL